MSSQHTIEIDVRKAQIDFGAIMKVVQEIKDHEVLSLHTSFNPLPLYPIMKRKGFEHDSIKIANNHWVIKFYKVVPFHLEFNQADCLATLDILTAIEELDKGNQLTLKMDHIPSIIQMKLDELCFEQKMVISTDGNIFVTITKTI